MRIRVKDTDKMVVVRITLEKKKTVSIELTHYIWGSGENKDISNL